MSDADPDREFLLRSLADLDRERAAGDIAEDDYADLRARYEARLTRTGLHPTPPGPADADQNEGRGSGSAAGSRSRWRTVVAVVVVAGVAVGAGIGVAAWSGSRQPGESATGTVPSTSQQQLAEAARLVAEGDTTGAIEVYQSLLDENPDDVAALTYFGWLLRNVGVQQDDDRLFDSGVAFIERATQLDPTFSEAWFFRGIIYLRDEDDPDKAVDALRLALANDPVPELESSARELLAEIAQGS